MIAYHGDKTLKTRLLRELAWHKRMDAIAQGSGGGFVGGAGETRWRGCAVACSLRSMTRARGAFVAERASYYDHAELADSMGVPLELLRLEDRIFEGLPPGLAMAWPQRFARAIKPGADLSLVWPRFALAILSDQERGARRHADARGKAAIATVAALLERRIAGDEPSADEWRAAEAAADAAAEWAAARAADAAAAEWAAARVAWAAEAEAGAAAWAAEAAAWAAEAAAWAAAKAAAYAAEEARAARAARTAAEVAEAWAAEAAADHYRWMSDTLETLLRAA